MTVIAIAAMPNISEALVLPYPQWTHDLIRKRALNREVIEPFHCGLDRLSPRVVFLDSIGVALAPPRARESKPTNGRGQQQTLAHERHQDNDKGHKQNKI